MRDRCYVKSDSLLSTEPSKGSFSKVCAIICDNAMWVTISQNDVFQERYNCVAITLHDWLDLDPLGELVHHHHLLSWLMVYALDILCTRLALASSFGRLPSIIYDIIGCAYLGMGCTWKIGSSNSIGSTNIASSDINWPVLGFCEAVLGFSQIHLTSITWEQHQIPVSPG